MDLCSLDGVSVVNWKQNSVFRLQLSSREHLPSMCEAWGPISSTTKANRLRATTTTVRPLTSSLGDPDLEEEGLTPHPHPTPGLKVTAGKTNRRAMVFRVYSEQGACLGEVSESWPILDLKFDLVIAK